MKLIASPAGVQPLRSGTHALNAPYVRMFNQELCQEGGIVYPIIISIIFRMSGARGPGRAT